MEPLDHASTRLHYDLHLEIDPGKQHITVNGSLVYHAPENRTERARFFLHHQLDIESLAGRRVLGYHLEKVPPGPQPEFLADAALLDIYFDPPLSAGETALVQFAYHGTLTDWAETSTSQLSPDWIELGQSLPWYPYLYDGSTPNLTFSLQVTSPPGFTAASQGSSYQQEGKTFFNWAHPTNDIVVVAAPNLRRFTFESEANRVLLHTIQMDDAAVLSIGEDLLWTLERFAGWFGPIRPSEFTLIESPRPKGGGYARRGLVVLAGMEPHEYIEQRESCLRYLAHEAAHAWWWNAPATSWEDWLNESFAEYSALMAIRERFGQEAFDIRLRQKREQAAGTLPLWEFDRNGGLSSEDQQRVETQLYHQGPLLLHSLADQVGNRRFLDLCRGMQWSGVTGTSHFLDLLEELEGKPVRDWMEAALKKQ
jgi:hypothetical protein